MGARPHEDDPDGTPEPRLVEAVFANYSPLMALWIGLQAIHTTPEHPFYVRDRGWTAAHQLMQGDQPRTEGGWI